MEGGTGMFTVSPACARMGSKSRFTRFPITRFPTRAGKASAATSFTIALATFADVIEGIVLLKDGSSAASRHQSFDAVVFRRRFLRLLLRFRGLHPPRRLRRYH